MAHQQHSTAEQTRKLTLQTTYQRNNTDNVPAAQTWGHCISGCVWYSRETCGH